MLTLLLPYESRASPCLTGVAVRFLQQVDFKDAGQIRDDDVFSTLIGPMPKGVTMTSIFDCCHSGSVLDLPYTFIADGEHEEMEVSPDFDFDVLVNLFNAYMANQQGGGGGGAGGDVDPVALIQKMCGPDCTVL